MDELELLGAARPVEPPSGQTVDDARNRLIRQIYALPAPRRRPRRRLLPLAAGAFAMSAGLVFGVHVLSPAPPVPATNPDSGTAQPGDRPARVLLLAAAERALTQPEPGEGAFWTATVEEGNLLQVGEPGNRYAIMGTTTETRWTPAAAGHPVMDMRWAGAEPASAADRAAWKRAGSPASWPRDPLPGCPVDPDDAYTVAPAGTSRVMPADAQSGVFDVLGVSLTAEQIRGLPSDPAELKTWLTGVIEKQNLPRGTGVQLGESLFDGVLNLLFDTPVTPQVRAAAYRVLAGVPGVESQNAVTDATGRRGAAVSVVRNDTVEEQRADPSGPYRLSLIFDPDSGRTLAQENRALAPADYMAWVPKDALFGYRALMSARWTDDRPPAANEQQGGQGYGRAGESRRDAQAPEEQC
ncbi:CU044_5270 family protein [Actinoplanes sp. NPDC051861]|uniref:CU044_5270 family protein n=1 Tax=Actinoplanes sp. NPDC051861 TaxID=3155170 RepID=UPI0034382EBF